MELEHQALIYKYLNAKAPPYLPACSFQSARASDHPIEVLNQKTKVFYFKTTGTCNQPR
jgi:hypothetical protein